MELHLKDHVHGRAVQFEWHTHQPDGTINVIGWTGAARNWRELAEATRDHVDEHGEYAREHCEACTSVFDVAAEFTSTFGVAPDEYLRRPCGSCGKPCPCECSICECPSCGGSMEWIA